MQNYTLYKAERIDGSYPEQQTLNWLACDLSVMIDVLWSKAQVFPRNTPYTAYAVCSGSWVRDQFGEPTKKPEAIASGAEGQ